MVMNVTKEILQESKWGKKYRKFIVITSQKPRSILFLHLKLNTRAKDLYCREERYAEFINDHDEVSAITTVKPLATDC